MGATSLNDASKMIDESKSLANCEGEQPIYSSLGEDPSFSKLVELLVAEIPERIRLFHELYNARNLVELERLAHQMKGVVGSYGFREAYSPAAELEAAIRRDAPLDTIKERLNILCETIARLSAGSSTSMSKRA